MMKNVWLYYFIAACQGAWFTEPVWSFYFKKFADYSTMAFWFSILNVAWILFEIPTGMIADKYGRKLATVVGTMFVTLGLGMVALTSDFWIWIFGLLFQNLGRSFISGSMEALIYDDLKHNHEEHRYDQIAANKSRITIAAYAIAVLIGGLVGKIYLTIPYLLFMTVSMASVVASFNLTEHSINLPKESGSQLSLEGIRQFFKPKLKRYLILSWLILFIYFVFDWGMAKPAMAVKFGFFETGQGILYAFIALLNVIVLRYLPLARRKISMSTISFYIFFFLCEISVIAK